MIPGRIECEVVLPVVFCVLAIFFFPAMYGPYPAVHGPVTALQAARFATRLKLTIVEVARTSLRICVVSSLVVLACTTILGTEFQSVSRAASSTVLRC